MPSRRCCGASVIAKVRNVFVLIAAIVSVSFLLEGAAQAGSEVVSFPVTDYVGDTLMLRAKLNRPEGDGPFPAVILLHGCEGLHPDGSWDDDYPFAAGGYDPRPFVSWGYVTLIIDSFGPRGIEEACQGRNGFVAPPATRARDAHAGKAFLASLPFVDGTRVGVVGYSHGGNTVLKAITNEALHEQMRQDPFAAAVAYYPGCPFQLRSVDAPLLILIGDADVWTRSPYCEAMELVGEVTHDYELVIYPGATHAFDWAQSDGVWGHYDAEAAEDALSRIRTLFAEYLH